LAEIFAFPPISFSLTDIGFLSTFCCPGALLAYIVTHVLSDRFAIRFAKKNNNIYEPEFRLVLMLPVLVLSPIAFSLFGWYNGTVAATTQISWVVSSILYGLIVFCVVNVNIVAFAYLLDAHREISVEACVFAIMLRNFFGYGVATFIAPWLASQGIAHTFYQIAGINFGVLFVATSFFYLFGKRMRGFLHEHDPMLALPVDVKRS
jgi:MFS family permease